MDRGIWRVGTRTYALNRRGMIMGILNITPDSFSDGGRYATHETAVVRGLEMVAEGADILDVGGESTRPGAAEVSVSDELGRILPVIRGLRAESDVLISVDTMKPEVAREAIAAGADIINDVNGLRDPRMREVAATADASVIIMHMQGTPRTMQASPFYEDVVAEVRAFFAEQLQLLTAAGLGADRVVFDPGFGFGKTLAHNLELLRNLDSLRVDDRPLAVGVSRKSMIASLVGSKDLASRHWPTVAFTSWMREAGAEIIRVHDVRANVEALRMTEAILSV